MPQHFLPQCKMVATKLVANVYLLANFRWFILLPAEMPGICRKIEQNRDEGAYLIDRDV